MMSIRPRANAHATPHPPLIGSLYGNVIHLPAQAAPVSRGPVKDPLADQQSHEVPSIGMHASGKRRHDGAPRGTLNDEEDPLFLLIAREAIKHELATLVDPPNPITAYAEQQSSRANRPYGGFYHDLDEDSIPPPDPAKMDAYETTVRSNAERRARLKANLAMVEEKLQAAMTPALMQKYLSMLQ